jgi:ribonuclease HII
MEKDYCLTESEVGLLSSDPRAAVRRLAQRALRARESRNEDERMLALERSMWGLGFKRILGMDEVGRGALAGSVCVGGVIFAVNGMVPAGVRDSKSLSPAQRAALVPRIVAAAIAHRVVCRDNSFVDSNGINAAIEDCQQQIIDELKPDYLLLDGFALSVSALPQQAMAKGDSKSVTIAAASILAKEHRDAVMKRLCPVYPAYDFSQNKGYGSSTHIDAVREHGPCAIHRLSFLQGVLGSVKE